MNIGSYYLNDPNAPKPNSPTHIGTNVYLQWQNQLLLEKRWDCGQWGLIGGRLKKGERYAQGIAREVFEETGLRLPESAFRQLRVVDDERIAAYRDGSVWRMVIVLFEAELTQEPVLHSSRESSEVRFFSRKELEDLPVVVTHRDLVEAWRNG